MAIRIGDFVTSCEAGYWQLIDIKPKFATEDHASGTVHYKKGDRIGQWVILKKAFTPKMKPRIEFSYLDAAWIRPVSEDVRREIQNYFSDHPEYQYKFDHAEVKLRPMITNCWINLSDEIETHFMQIRNQLPPRFTLEKFWEAAAEYKTYISNPPTSHVINFLTYPWLTDRNANLVYIGWNLVRL